MPDDHGVKRTGTTEWSASSAGMTALVLGGGGARSAYQAGVLRGIGRRHPSLTLPILTGISAGAINAAYLAAHEGTLGRAAEDLVSLWLSLRPEQVYRVDAPSLIRNVAGWAWRLASGGASDRDQHTRGLVETAPLHQLLRGALGVNAQGEIGGIERNVARGRLHAVAVSATSYSTGLSVTWVHGAKIAPWQRPQRRSEVSRLGVGHVMASAALPLLFPAVRVGDEWFGDGGIRLTAPLSPALHLGAERVLTISTRYARSRAEASVSQIDGYPPPAQVLGVLYNAIFLDVIDQDIVRLQMMNELLAKVPARDRGGLRHVDILVLRPSADLGQMAREYEPRLPQGVRFLTRGWGTRRTRSPDILSLLMFQSDYVRALVELGERDAEAHMPEIDAFVSGEAPSSTAAMERRSEA